MHTWIPLISCFALLLGLPADAYAGDRSVHRLPEFRVEGMPWRYARWGEMEILTRAPESRTRQFVAALIRGQRLFPEFLTQGASLPLYVILAEERTKSVAGLTKAKWGDANPRDWHDGYRAPQSNGIDAVVDGTHIVAINLANISTLWSVLSIHARERILSRQPSFPDWMTRGLFGPCGLYRAEIGVARTSTVKLPRLSWPDPASEPDMYPRVARDWPDFAAMFNAAWRVGEMAKSDRWKFDFQTALFARWSLFGPVKNGRSRNGYWVFAEMARRGQATESAFRECYGMDWAQACAEMRAYLKPKNLGMPEVRMPHVMADVPEAERMEFRDATLEEVRRILGEFNRLRVAEAEHDRANGKSTRAQTPH